MEIKSERSSIIIKIKLESHEEQLKFMHMMKAFEYGFDTQYLFENYLEQIKQNINFTVGELRDFTSKFFDELQW